MIREILVSKETQNPFSDSFGLKNPILDFLKETQNPFSDSFGLKNPILDFLKETHPYTEKMLRKWKWKWNLMSNTESACAITRARGS